VSPPKGPGIFVLMRVTAGEGVRVIVGRLVFVGIGVIDGVGVMVGVAVRLGVRVTVRVGLGVTGVLVAVGGKVDAFVTSGVAVLASTTGTVVHGERGLAVADTAVAD
jgi:hypothetical protein